MATTRPTVAMPAMMLFSGLRREVMLVSATIFSLTCVVPYVTAVSGCHLGRLAGRGRVDGAGLVAGLGPGRGAVVGPDVAAVGGADRRILIGRIRVDGPGLVLRVSWARRRRRGRCRGGGRRRGWRWGWRWDERTGGWAPAGAAGR